MSNKKRDFRELSNVNCKRCGFPIKQNVIDRQPGADTCYSCDLLTKKKNPKRSPNVVRPALAR